MVVGGVSIFKDAKRNQGIKDAVLGNIVKAKFNPNDLAFKNDECAICLEKFTDDCEVTPLPCNVKHYFHPDCIEDWLKQKNSCPLCKAVLNPEDMAKLQKEIEERFSEERMHNV